MKVIYVADDGTQFEDEYECLNYEWRARNWKRKVTLKTTVSMFNPSVGVKYIKKYKMK